MISIDSEGEGRDLVLLPGWGMHRAMWGELPSRLATYARVHVCELREPSEFESLTDHLATASAEKVDVLGWSLGGMMAMNWALRYPQQVERLVLLSSTPSFVTRENWPHGTAPAILKNFDKALRADVGTLMQSFLQGLATGEPEADVLNVHLGELFAQRPPLSQAVLQNGLQFLAEIDLRASLPEIIQPVLLLHGEEDVITPVGASRWMTEHLSRARLQILPRAGHAPHLSQLELVSAAVYTFLYD